MNSANNSDTVNKVCAILEPLFDVAITPNDSTETLKEWDSLRYLEVVAALEDTLGLEFTAVELLQLSSVQKIATTIDAKKAEG